MMKVASVLVRHGFLPEREVLTGIGNVAVQVPRVRDRGANADGSKLRFTSSLVPPADSTRECNFTHGMMGEAAMPNRFSPSKVKDHECEPTPASLKVSVTKFMR